MRLAGRHVLFMLPLILGICLFFALGIWQLERREWKLALIASVEQGLKSTPMPAPAREHWDALQPYQKVVVKGRWITKKDTLVLAVTKMGRGYWVLTPLRTDRNFIVLVNRGFIPENLSKQPVLEPLEQNEIEITGFLRLSEPPKAFLRYNDPENNRWYSRNIDQMARAKGLTDIAPYFVDADKSHSGNQYPVGGLTVLHFRNNHLVYALTWFSMAAGLLAAVTWMSRPRES